MNEDDKTTDLGTTIEQTPSNSDPTFDTQSQANPLKRVVTVGRNPETKSVSFSGS